jgi:hypothetical protein
MCNCCKAALWIWHVVTLALHESSLQVALGMLHGRRSQRTTAATLCNLLLALAASCPAAATPQLMHHIWASLSQLLHTVQPSHAAAVAWAASHNSSSSLQPPPQLLQGLMQRVAVVAEDASQQQLAMLLLEAARAGWQLEQQPLQLLLSEMLRKQAAALSEGCSAACDVPGGLGSTTSSSETQQSRQDLSSSQDVSSLASRGTCCSSNASSSSSSSSSSQAARLYGLANHRLKSSLAASGAAAAWAHAMSTRGRMSALLNCQALAMQLDNSMLPLLAIHVCCLAGAETSSSRNRSDNIGGRQQLRALPAGLAAVLWREQEHVLPQLSSAQQRAMQRLWKAVGLCD